MNKAKATKVLAEIENQFSAFLDRPTDPRPNLRDHNHEEQSPGSWSIEWEEGPDDWAMRFTSKIPGVFVEPIYTFMLGVYDA